jgi:hypothetical protein
MVQVLLKSSSLTTELFSFFLTILPILTITRAFRGRHLLHKLPEYADLTLDSIVLGNNPLERTHFIGAHREGGLGIV